MRSCGIPCAITVAVTQAACASGSHTATTPSESASPSQVAEDRSGPGPEAQEHSEPATSRGPHPLVDDREPDPSRALPKLSYEHLGMHIGGESNSPESKRPWFSDIEANEEALLACYRFVTNPEKGGSYGVDLYVGRKGGAPEVRGSRQKLGGEDFDECMRKAFGSIEFHVPERPTVFSYSILFRLGE